MWRRLGSSRSTWPARSRRRSAGGAGWACWRPRRPSSSASASRACWCWPSRRRSSGRTSSRSTPSRRPSSRCCWSPWRRSGRRAAGGGRRRGPASRWALAPWPRSPRPRCWARSWAESGRGAAGAGRACRTPLRGRAGRLGDSARLPGRPVRRALDRGRPRPAVMAARPRRPRRGGPGAGDAGRAGGRAGPPLRLRPPRRPAPRLGAGVARGNGLVAVRSSRVPRARYRVAPGGRGAASRLTRLGNTRRGKGVPALGVTGRRARPSRRRARRRRRPASSSAATPIFIRAAGIRHSRASRSISAHVAARASPDRQAVSTTNRRHALTATAADESAIVSRAAPTSWYGRVRKCALSAGSDVRGGRNPLRLLCFLGISGNRREEGVAPQSRAMMRHTATSIPSSASARPLMRSFCAFFALTILS